MFSVLPEIIIILAIVGIIIVIIRRIPNAAGVPLKTSASQQKLFAETTMISKFINYFSNFKERVKSQLAKASREKNITQKETVPIEPKSEKQEIREPLKEETILEKEKEPEKIIVPKEPSFKKVIKPEPEKKPKLVSQGNREQEILEKIVEHPKDPQPYKELAELYALQGNSTDAIKALREVLKISPNDLMAEEKMEELIESQKKI